MTGAGSRGGHRAAPQGGRPAPPGRLRPCGRNPPRSRGLPVGLDELREALAGREHERGGALGSIVEAMEGTDLFIGLSGPGIIKARDLERRDPDPFVFAMANPDPEVSPQEAAPYVRVMATGHSDYPNQINNVLAFPGIFRGALDVRARDITERDEDRGRRRHRRGRARRRAVRGLHHPDRLRPPGERPGRESADRAEREGVARERESQEPEVPPVEGRVDAGVCRLEGGPRRGDRDDRPRPRARAARARRRGHGALARSRGGAAAPGRRRGDRVGGPHGGPAASPERPGRARRGGQPGRGAGRPALERRGQAGDPRLACGRRAAPGGGARPGRAAARGPRLGIGDRLVRAPRRRGARRDRPTPATTSSPRSWRAGRRRPPGRGAGCAWSWRARASCSPTRAGRSSRCSRPSSWGWEDPSPAGASMPWIHLDDEVGALPLLPRQPAGARPREPHGDPVTNGAFSPGARACAEAPRLRARARLRRAAALRGDGLGGHLGHGSCPSG